jgi:hypothetical protein
MFGTIGVTALVLLVAVLILAGCLQPVRNVQDHPLPRSTQNLSLEESGKNIIQRDIDRSFVRSVSGAR